MFSAVVRSVAAWSTSMEGPLAKRDFAHFLEVAAALTVIGFALMFWQDLAGLAQAVASGVDAVS